MITALATRILEGPWDERMLVSFYDGDVGPILRNEIFAHPVRDDGTLLVNLKECLRPVVLPVLDAMGLRYRLVPDPRVNFEKALAACSFVLSTAGTPDHRRVHRPEQADPRHPPARPVGAATERGDGGGDGKGQVDDRGPSLVDLMDFQRHLERYRSNSVPPRFSIPTNGSRFSGGSRPS